VDKGPAQNTTPNETAELANDGRDASSAKTQFASLVRHRESTEHLENGEPVIKTHEFSVFYGAKEAVKKISVDIPKNAVTAIIGPSGCGKSTFLNAINRMTSLIPGCTTQGTLHFKGRDVYDRDLDVVALRRNIGMVFQKPNPFPKSIHANIAYGPRLHGKHNRQELDEIVERSLKEAGVWDEVKDRLKDNALRLSGGQQQRLCIARALAVNPELMLLDEPTSALDPSSTKRVEDLIDDMRNRYSVVIVTHNMQQAARVSDYCMLLYEGEIVEFGPTLDMFTRPKQKRTLEYINGVFG